MAFMHSAVGTGGGKEGGKGCNRERRKVNEADWSWKKGGEGEKLESKEKAIFMQTSNMG